MDEQDLESLLLAVLPGKPSNDNTIVDIETFFDAGLIDPEAGPRDFFEPYYGVVVTMSDGEEFHLTILQHSGARPEEDEESE
jgi:hypothetical protein